MGRGASTNSIPEIENARFLFVIGSNTTEAHPVLALRIKKAVRNGATLVVADPRKIWLTKLATRHLQLRPGTDVWLLNAMMHTILAEGLQNEEYIRELTEDFDAVREVVARYSPEDAEKVTGVPADDIRATAREYASERHAAIFYTLGITEHACGVDNIWSLSNLVLMTGHLGYESTGLNALRGQNNVQGLNDSGANPSYLPGYQPVDDPEVWQKFSDAWGVEVPKATGYRLDQMMSGLHDDRVKAMYLIGENPAQTEPNAHHVEEGLGNLEFLISQDIFLHDMTRKHADVVFPASSFAEKDGTFTNTERRISRVREGAPLPGNAKGDREIVILMAKALGANWPEYPDAESVWNELADLAPNWYGVRYDRIEENGVQWPVTEIGGPDTPHLHAPAPARPPGKGKFFPVEYQRPIEEPDSEYPLVLSTGRTLYHYNSATMTMRESGITDKQVEPFFEISAEDASALGLAQDDLARLVSRRGALEARAHISDRVFPGLVWMALHFAEQKVNWLTHDVTDSLIGTPEFKVSAVRVERAGRLATVCCKLSVNDTLAPAAVEPHLEGRFGKPYLYEPECASTQQLLLGSELARGRRRRHGSPDRRSGEVGACVGRAGRKLGAHLGPPRAAARAAAARALARRRSCGGGDDRGRSGALGPGQVAERRDAEPPQGRRRPLRALRRDRRRRHRDQREPDPGRAPPRRPHRAGVAANRDRDDLRPCGPARIAALASRAHVRRLARGRARRDLRRARRA